MNVTPASVSFANAISKADNVFWLVIPSIDYDGCLGVIVIVEGTFNYSNNFRILIPEQFVMLALHRQVGEFTHRVTLPRFHCGRRWMVIAESPYRIHIALYLPIHGIGVKRVQVDFEQVI